MYTGFEMALAVMFGALLGIALGLFVYFLAAGEIRERERAQAAAEWEEWASHMEIQNASLKREVKIWVRVSENLDSQLINTLNERTTGHYVFGESTLTSRPDGGYGIERKREHKRGEWRDYSGSGLLEAAVIDAETENGGE